MSCLGDRLTALVDGELDHDGRDRALAHLAGCDGCRAEVEALRCLKRRLNALKEVSAGSDLLARLHGMGAEAGMAPPRPDVVWSRMGADGQDPSGTPARGLYRLDGQGQAEEFPPDHRRPRDNRPVRGHRHQQPTAHRRLPRARYLVAGAATLAALGAGSAPYSTTAGTARAPKVSPGWSQVSVHNGVSQIRLPRR